MLAFCHRTNIWILNFLAKWSNENLSAHYNNDLHKPQQLQVTTYCKPFHTLLNTRNVTHKSHRKHLGKTHQSFFFFFNLTVTSWQKRLTCVCRGVLRVALISLLRTESGAGGQQQLARVAQCRTERQEKGREGQKGGRERKGEPLQKTACSFY